MARISTSAIQALRPKIASVFDGRDCVGFVLNRGRAGFEAFDQDENSFGTFPTMAKAAAALPSRNEGTAR